ncbi:GvpL/GvpF family gas vesicle protein [Nonomuraea cavernae]|uniref:Gas vesicle protein n=1 Tax=Nonomuraea cavernae TaxID=2045107 RepID=A0A918DPX4_9ACTN|nr:GvpL/GvpF family gas vesicle protein [Nonomuraea cavernae]MCA2189831.1 GvpL/GvpF family gas vesicle protein [Nonomuraea cavernae]GGO77618.1 gas vesicle protein [Nonomuraea cavernae]
MPSDEGVYLYAVTRAEEHACPEGLTGVSGLPVRSLAHRGLAALYSLVSLDEFGEERLRRSMEDLSWLEETARGHHRVVEAVARVLPTAPARLVTVYRLEQQLRDLLDERHDGFVAVLSHVAGRSEWAVKAYAEPYESAPADESGPEDDRPGLAYLKRRRAGLHGREAAWRRAATRAEFVHEVLMSVAVEGRLHRAQDPQLSGREELMVLNGAYLVDEDRADEFARVLGDLDGDGVTVELVGPWAPYSFAVLEGEAARGAAP